MGAPNDCTAEEIALAYRRAELRKIGVTLTRALQDSLLYKSLCLQVGNMRKHQIPCTHLHAQQLTEREAA